MIFEDRMTGRSKMPLTQAPPDLKSHTEANPIRNPFPYPGPTFFPFWVLERPTKQSGAEERT
ncbi:hypothetical protein CCP4SC76_6710018 [Gammaproteobacteria bacterium]